MGFGTDALLYLQQPVGSVLSVKEKQKQNAVQC